MTNDHAHVYTLTVRGIRRGFSTASECSKWYSELRAASGEGASTWPPVKLFRDKKLIGRISYNGRIWNLSDQPYEE